MRILTNVLAGFLVLMGSAAALANLVIIVLGLTHAASVQARIPADSPVFVIVLMAACLCFLGAFFAYRAWMHLRKPDAGTARDVINLTIYWIFIVGLAPILRHDSYFAIPAIVVLVLIRHFLIKRLTPQFAGLH